jgi:ribosomal protein L32E
MIENCEFWLIPFSINKESTTLERRQLCFQIAHSIRGQKKNKALRKQAKPLGIGAPNDNK